MLCDPIFSIHVTTVMFIRFSAEPTGIDQNAYLKLNQPIKLSVTAAAPAPPPAPSPVRQPESAPQFAIQLTNQPITLGGTAHFECKVAGFPPPEILWTRKGHPLVDKTRYVLSPPKFVNSNVVLLSSFSSSYRFDQRSIF